MRCAKRVAISLSVTLLAGPQKVMAFPSYDEIRENPVYGCQVIATQFPQSYELEACKREAYAKSVADWCVKTKCFDSNLAAPDESSTSTGLLASIGQKLRLSHWINPNNATAWVGAAIPGVPIVDFGRSGQSLDSGLEEALNEGGTGYIEEQAKSRHLEKVDINPMRDLNKIRGMYYNIDRDLAEKIK